MSWIQTYTGKIFTISPVNKEAICLEDIAHALSNTGRYTGHTKQFYSVAQHSVICSWMAPQPLKRIMFGHDFSEAYLADIATPVKNLLPEYKVIENSFMEAIASVFDFEWPLPQECRDIDLRMLKTERLQLLGKEPKPWGIDDYVVPYDITIEPWDHLFAKYMFILTASELEFK